MKHLYWLIAITFLISCGNQPAESKTTDETITKKVEFFGNTQGTTYSVIVNDPIKLKAEEIDSLLANFDLALSGYIPNSTITHLNEAPAGAFIYSDTADYFNRCYQLSQKVYFETNGAFDPTVFPLVKGWGFLKKVGQEVPDSSTVDSLRALTGFNDGYHFTFKLNEDSLPENRIIKNSPAAQLDFNAIAQGLAVDVLAEFIETKGAKNYFIEIGGEIRVKGKNAEGQFWRIGIDKPIEDSNAEDRVIYEIVQVENKSIATSGSYRKFYEKNGVKYSHTLDPKTGYPVQHSLLSATVIADDCATADAMATALMVMGPVKGINFVNENPHLKIEAYLIFNNDKDRLETYYTKGFKEMIYED